MASVYPGALDSFSTKQDGVPNVIYAAHVNDLQNSVVAVETELGTHPAGSMADLKTRLAVRINDDGTLILYDLSTQDRLHINHITLHIASVAAGATAYYAALTAKETMRIQEISVWARAKAGAVAPTFSLHDDGATIQTTALTIAAAATIYTAVLNSRLTTIAEGSTVSLYITTNAGDGSLTDLTVDIAYYAS